MSPLGLAILDDCTPARFARLEAGLLAAAPPRPLLLVAPLTAPGLLLGRHQRAASALELEALAAGRIPVARRAGGGWAIQPSPGDLALLLWAPPGDPLAAAPFPAERIMNRYVRGLLAGLRALGARNAAYFGRDFVSCDGRRLAVVSQESTPEGGAAFEAVVAVAGTLAPQAGLERERPHPDPRAGGPPPTSLGQLTGSPRPSLAAIVEALVLRHGEALGRTLEPWPGELPEAEPPPAVEDEVGLASGGEEAIPAGFLEALASPSTGRLARPRLRGEFLAPAHVIRALERSLDGAPLEATEIGRRVDAAFAAPGAFVHGVRSLASFARAALGAGRAPAG